eukprot:6521039-Pyramimonas_sp.AAC.1
MGALSGPSRAARSSRGPCFVRRPTGLGPSCSSSPSSSPRPPSCAPCGSRCAHSCGDLRCSACPVTCNRRAWCGAELAP